MVDDTKKTASGNDFLVFINFSKASYNALDYTIKLVKAVGGSIEVHYIINPEEIADSENHFVAVRSINELRYKARKKLNSIVEMLVLENIDVMSSYTMGHFETEFKGILAKNESKTIVIGNRKSAEYNRTLYTLINQFTGNVLVVNDDSGYQGETKIAIGMNIQNYQQSGISLISNLSHSTKMPIVILNSQNGTDSPDKAESLPMFEKGLEIYMYNLEEHNNVLEKMLEYAEENNVEILCVARKKTADSLIDRVLRKPPAISKIIRNSKTPLFIIGNN